MSNVIYLAGRDQRSCIVLVEHDPLMRIATAAHLRKAGLSVIEAVDSAEALALLRSGRTISLILGDLDPGTETLSAIRAEFPQVRVVVGCADDTLAIPHGGPISVGRPYDPSKVIRLVKALLAGRNSRS
jgi:DNA-binding NarL/FixJ family response regulator